MTSARFIGPLISLIAVLAEAPDAALAQSDAQRLTQIEAMFNPAAIVSGPELVECTLSGGAETTCFSITVTSSLTDDDMGPWVPTQQCRRAGGFGDMAERRPRP
jgi:hypothetical protein